MLPTSPGVLGRFFLFRIFLVQPSRSLSRPLRWVDAFNNDNSTVLIPHLFILLYLPSLCKLYCRGIFIRSTFRSVLSCPFPYVYIIEIKSRMLLSNVYCYVSTQNVTHYQAWTNGWMGSPTLFALINQASLHLLSWTLLRWQCLLISACWSNELFVWRVSRIRRSLFRLAWTITIALLVFNSWLACSLNCHISFAQRSWLPSSLVVSHITR